MSQIEWFILKSSGQEFYVKRELYPKYGNNFQTASLLFGGVRTFCVTIAIKSESIAFVNRVEFDEFCNKVGKMEENKGMEVLLKGALWFTLQLYPTIKIFNLEDDSHIYCIKKSKTHKLSLAYDYILKYGQTWYEKKFHAVLSEHMTHDYKKSQAVLDMPLIPYEEFVKVYPTIKSYESTYRAAKSPRDFIGSLRTELGLDTYCMEVGKWLTNYVELLGVQMFKEKWFILRSSVKEPDGFELEKLTYEPRVGGASRLKTRKQRVSRKARSGGGIGYYNAKDEY
jgi:hypothetical protein